MGGDLRFDWRVATQQRIEAWLRRNPRGRSWTAVGVLIAVVVIDLVRFAQIRDRLSAEDWTSGSMLGGVIALFLALVAYVIRYLWLRGGRTESPLVIAAFIVVFALFWVTHPRYADDSGMNAEDVAWLVGADVLLVLLLTVVAYRVWPRSRD